MIIDPSGVKILETDQEIEDYLNSLPDGGAGTRAILEAEKNGTFPESRIVDTSMAEDGSLVLYFESEDQAAQWAKFCQGVSHPEAKFECNGTSVKLPSAK
ncbi:MAG TPA: hypothetical protein V6D29_06840 [Leptolyngbyaceae cyanobacterium]